MTAPKRIDGDLTQAELDEILRSIPPDLESTPEEDAEDLAAFKRGEEQIRRGQWSWFEDIERKYPD